MNATDAPLHDSAEGQGTLQAPMGPGAMLRAAREAAGLSLEQVAQQLKLAPRQVKALEDESFADLPGRTFSRGFVRNYARLLNLDAQDLLEHLPDAAHAPALGSPALHPTGAMIAELPASASSRSSFGRWLIPAVLAGCIVAAAAYEFYRGGVGSFGDASRPAPEIASNKSAAPSLPPTATVLPNPLAGDVKPADEPVSAAASDARPAPPATIAAQPAASADAPLMLSFQGPSWTEIRDANGQVLVSRLIEANSVEPVRGAPPFDLVLGNAPAVSVTYRGKAVDLAPYTRQNVARITLK